MGSVGDLAKETTVEVNEEKKKVEVNEEKKKVEVNEEKKKTVEVNEEKKTVEVNAEPDVQEVEDAGVVKTVEVNVEPDVQTVEDVAVEKTVDGAAVEVNEEPDVQDVAVEKTVDGAAVEVNEEPDVQDVAVEKTVDGASVEVNEEADVQEVGDVAMEQEVEGASVGMIVEKVAGEPHVYKVEDASVEAKKEEQEVCAGVEKEGNGAGEPESNGGVAAEETEIAPPRRKLPTLKRFSARRSVGPEDGPADAGPDATAPSVIRRQRGARRIPGRGRAGMGIDDRDTVDYTKPKFEEYTEPKPEEYTETKPEENTEPKPEEVVTQKTPVVRSVAEREQLRLLNIKRIKNIQCVERVKGKLVDVTAGLELHTGVFSRVEQQRLVDLVRDLQAKGRRNELKERTFNEPRKWMRGKGRVTLQFGCCYNYALDKHGNPPGILRDDVVDPIPPLLRTTIKRLVRWHVLPPTCVPDSCIINIYDVGDCIPPHIDHHDFLRPFCTLSLLSECNIVFGTDLEVLGAGNFGGSMSLPLPVGSVLVLNGNGADVAKHAIPTVPTERMSITFRKMDPAKVPRGFTIDNELQNLRPVVLQSMQPEDS